MGVRSPIGRRDRSAGDRLAEGGRRREGRREGGGAGAGAGPRPRRAGEAETSEVGNPGAEGARAGSADRDAGARGQRRCGLAAAGPALTWAAPHSGAELGPGAASAGRRAVVFLFFFFFSFFRSRGGSSAIRRQLKAESVSGCERAWSRQRGRSAAEVRGAARRAARELRRPAHAGRGAPLRGPSAQPPARPRSPLARRSGPRRRRRAAARARATVSKLAAAPGTEAEREARGRGRSQGRVAGTRATAAAGRGAGAALDRPPGTPGATRTQHRPLRKGAGSGPEEPEPGPAGGAKGASWWALGEQRKGRACWFRRLWPRWVARLRGV